LSMRRQPSGRTLFPYTSLFRSEWGLNYIAQRYGTPKRAWAHHLAKNWYDRGAWEIPHDQPAVVHKGEMIIPAKQAEKIRDVLLRENVSHNTTTNNTNHNITFGPNSIQIGRASCRERVQELMVDGVRNEE